MPGSEDPPGFCCGRAPLIVYGDPQFEEDATGLITRLRTHARGLRHRLAEPLLDDLRGMLIQVGQLEQAGSDELPRLLPGAEARGPLHLLQSATDLAAAAFYARWRETQPSAPAGATGVREALARLEGSLGRVPALSGARLAVKVPEGFGFYALYPEQYAVSTLRWHADRQGEGTRRVAVVGIRSIGTTLSAVVAEVLKAAGWQVSRQTVRPSGHPFSREVAIEPGTLGEPAWGLVVDEGPGLSGSSLAATAEALCSAGLARSHISFLASHEAAPAGASEAARSWWQSGRVYATPFQALRWGGRTMPERLAARCGDFGVGRRPAAQIEDCGGGQWRELVYLDEDDWPAAAGPFERTKYRCTRPGAPAVLWKFAGQACLRSGEGSAVEATREALAARARAGWTPEPLDAMDGLIALPWVEGAPLRRDDGDPVTLAQIGRYIREVAGPCLLPAEQETALRRLEEILYWNTWESLGEERAAQTRSWARTAVELCGTGPIASYGDGRLAPWEWRRAPTGSLLKLDGVGHDVDHTAVGRQSLLWDVAGAMVEWELDIAEARPLLDTACTGMPAALPPALLDFYRMAHAAFRLGQCRLCADMCSGWPQEQARLWQAAATYRRVLERLLQTEPEVQAPAAGEQTDALPGGSARQD
jgi:hypothetical protein